MATPASPTSSPRSVRFLKARRNLVNTLKMTNRAVTTGAAKTRSAISEKARHLKTYMAGHDEYVCVSSLPDQDDSVDDLDEEFRVFGRSLDVVCQHSSIHPQMPDIVYKSIVYLLKHGVKEEGIFRLSGSVPEISKMKKAFDTGLNVSLEGVDPHAVACLLKQYLRELPEHIIPDLHVDGSDKLSVFTEFMHRDFTPAKFVLANLFCLLSEVKKHQDVTKMGDHNLSIVFCPSLKCGMEMFLLLLNHNEIFDETLFITSLNAYFQSSDSLTHSDSDDEGSGIGSNVSLTSAELL